VTISPSPIPSVSKTPLRKKHAMPSFSKSTKSEVSPNHSRPPPMPTQQDGVLWSLIVPARQRILSLLIFLLVFVLDKSKLVPLVAGILVCLDGRLIIVNVLPSITSF
jgi:hypothetical protein